MTPEDLAEVASRHGPSAYVLTVSDEGKPRIIHVPVVVTDGVISATVGRGAAANAVARPEAVTVLWPAADDGFSLIADGRATVMGEPGPDTAIEIAVTWAVRHRPAPL